MQKIDKMDEAWRERCRLVGFTADSVYGQGQYEDLKRKLLERGGEAVILETFTNSEVHKLMNNAVFSVGIPVKKVGGIPGHCHQNVEKYKDKYKAFTGFALSSDGAWRTHSWLYDQKNHVILETTTPRVLYYGYPDES